MHWSTSCLVIFITVALISGGYVWHFVSSIWIRLLWQFKQVQHIYVFYYIYPWKQQQMLVKKWHFFCALSVISYSQATWAHMWNTALSTPLLRAFDFSLYSLRHTAKIKHEAFLSPAARCSSFQTVELTITVNGMKKKSKKKHRDFTCASFTLTETKLLCFFHSTNRQCYMYDTF